MSPMKLSCEIISKSDQWFQRRRFFKNFFMSVYCKWSPFTRGVTDHNFANSFWKGSPKKHFSEIILKSDQRRRFLKNCLNEIPFDCHGNQTFFYGIKFNEQVSKVASQETFLPSLVRIGLAVWEEKMRKEIVDSRRTILKAPLEHVVLR